MIVFNSSLSDLVQKFVLGENVSKVEFILDNENSCVSVDITFINGNILRINFSFIIKPIGNKIVAYLKQGDNWTELWNL